MIRLRRMMLVFVLLLMSLESGAQKYVKYDKVDLNLDASGVYAKGDTVRVYADVKPGCAVELFLDVEINGKIDNRKVLSLPEGRSVVFERCFDFPTHLVVGLGPVSNRMISTRIGAIVHPEDFRPGYEEPADFRSYWDAQISAMRAVSADAVITLVEQGDPSVRCWSLEIPMHEGMPVRGYVAMPAEAGEQSLPIYIKPHAAGTLLSIHTRARVEEAVKMARQGAIALDINAHGMLNDAPQKYYEKLEARQVLMYQDRPVRDRETYYFRLMYLRLVRALDYLCALKEWDGKRVLVMGESQGGGQALVLAGLDSRVDAVVAIVPALTDLGGVKDGLRRSGWPYNKRPMVPYSSRASGVLPYFDAALHMKYFTGKLYVEAGLVDMVCNPACVTAGYNNCPSLSKFIDYFPYRPHNGMPECYKAEWESMVLTNRERFINDYLK